MITKISLVLLSFAFLGYHSDHNWTDTWCPYFSKYYWICVL